MREQPTICECGSCNRVHPTVSRSRVFERLGHTLRGWTPAGRVTKLEKQLASAGAPVGWSVERLLSVKLLLAVGCAVLALLLVDVTFVGVLLVLLAGTGGFIAPDVLLQRRSRRPQQARSVENSPTSSIR